MAKNNFKPRSKFEKWVRANGGTKGVAEALNVRQCTVQNWLSGHCRPRGNNCLKLLELSGKKLTIQDIIDAFHEARKRKVKHGNNLSLL